jgi:putative ATP-dependent endonuclease of OLD family
MRISRISCANFRRVHDFSIDVGRHLVLVGPNDSGKSSILRMLDSTLSRSYSLNLQPKDFADRAKPISFEVTLCDLSDQERIAFVDEIDRSAELTLRIRLEVTIDQVDGTVNWQRVFPDFEYTPVAAKRLDDIGWAFVAATRVLSRNLQAQRGGPLWNLLASMDLGDLSGVKAAMDAYRDALQDDPSLRELKTGLAEALNATLPREVTAEDLVLIAGGRVDANPLANVQIAFDDDGDLTGLDEQSDGIRALADLALRSVGNSSAQIVGIDEPELHLHPPAQRGIGRLLARNSVQQVLATNSANLLSQFAPTDVAAINPKHHLRTLPAGAPASTATFVARWWAQPMIEPLTASRLIVVEGVTDRIVLLACAEAMGRDLDRHAIATYDLDGASSITSVVQLYGSKGFDIPLLGLVDEDHQVEWADAFGVALQDLASTNVQVCVPDLEGHIVASLGADRTLEMLVSGGVPERKIRMGCQCLTGSILSSVLARWMRRNKKEAAVAIAGTITAEDARLLEPLKLLIDCATS